jgi:hypothetical protein
MPSPSRAAPSGRHLGDNAPGARSQKAAVRPRPASVGVEPPKSPMGKRCPAWPEHAVRQARVAAALLGPGSSKEIRRPAWTEPCHAPFAAALLGPVPGRFGHPPIRPRPDDAALEPATSPGAEVLGRSKPTRLRLRRARTTLAPVGHSRLWLTAPRSDIRTHEYRAPTEAPVWIELLQAQLKPQRPRRLGSAANIRLTTRRRRCP